MTPAEQSDLLAALERQDAGSGTILRSDAIRIVKEHLAKHGAEQAVDEDGVRQTILAGLSERVHHGGETLLEMYSYNVLHHIKAAGYLRQPAPVDLEAGARAIYRRLPPFRVAIDRADALGNAEYAEADMQVKPIHPLVCVFGCKDAVVAVVHTPDGCLCAGNKYQPRCAEHLRKLIDTNDGEFEIVEDFRIWQVDEQLKG